MNRLYYQDSHVSLYNTDSRDMSELPDSSVQCCITSPPYWGLRKYAGLPDLIWGGDEKCEHQWVDESITIYENKGGQHWQAAYGGATGKNRFGYGNTDSSRQELNMKCQRGFCSLCGAWKGQLGLEPTPELYLDHLVEICREIRRVMRKDGVFFLNIGDSYYGGGNNQGNKKELFAKQASNRGAVGQVGALLTAKHPVLKPKDLCLIPFRVAISAQEDGWWVRSVIIWNKPNPMPESVTDRPTESHEYILMLTKSARYYFDQEAVRTSYQPSSLERTKYPVNAFGTTEPGVPLSKSNVSEHIKVESNPSGANIKSVWTFPTQGFPGAHFATYPEKLVEICIKAASKEGDLILDPFCGSGTTLAVAKRKGRKATGYELSPEYCKLAVKRVEAVTAPLSGLLG